MTLWKKTLIIVSLFMTCAIVVVTTIAWSIVLGNYNALETAYMKQNTQRVLNALDNKLNNIDIILSDWTYWDDTYAFVQGTYPEYIEENLLNPTFTNLKLNVMAFIDARGQIIFDKMVDLDTGQEIALPPALQAYLADFFLAQYPGLEENLTGIAILPEEMVLIAAQPVLHTSGQGPPAGLMVMGRYLDQPVIDDLQEKTQVTITIYRLDAPQIPQDVYTSLIKTRSTLIRPLNADTIVGYALATDLYGEPGFVIETQMNRDIYRQGRATLAYFTASMVVVGIVFDITALIFLRRTILDRLSTLNTHVNTIATFNDPSRRVPVSGIDELSKLEEAINEMLTGLDHARAEQFRAETALREYSKGLEDVIRERTAQIQAHNTRLNAILRSTTDGIVVATADGTILQMNPVVHTLLTRSLIPEDRERVQEAIRHMAQQPHPQPIEILELHGIDLELNAAQLTESPDTAAHISPVADAQGSGQPSVVIAIHNVSHLKALARMQASFIASVSHELRTPVTTIKLYVDLLQRRPAKTTLYLNALERAANQQINLIETVLILSRIDAGHLTLRRIPIDINALTKHMLTSDIVQLAKTQQVRLNCAVDEQPLTVLADKEYISRVIYNLVINGLQYTNAGGELTLTSGSAVKEGLMWVWLKVSDTGIGIAEEDLPYIFERFYRGTHIQNVRASGAGLGLSLAKGIMTLHGGSITVESQKDKGSIFTLWLPDGEPV